MASEQVRLLNEKDFIGAARFIKEHKNITPFPDIGIAPAGDLLSLYEDYHMRTRQFHQNELFIGYFLEDKLCAIISFTHGLKSLTVFYIGLFMMLSEDYGAKLLHLSSDMFKAKGVKYFKVKIDDTSHNNKTSSFLKSHSFSYETTLKGEGHKLTDVDIYKKDLEGNPND